MERPVKFCLHITKGGCFSWTLWWWKQIFFWESQAHIDRKTESLCDSWSQKNGAYYKLLKFGKKAQNTKKAKSVLFTSPRCLNTCGNTSSWNVGSTQLRTSYDTYSLDRWAMNSFCNALVHGKMWKIDSMNVSWQRRDSAGMVSRNCLKGRKMCNW